MNPWFDRKLLTLVCLLSTSGVSAEVVAESAHGFVIRHQVTVDLPPADAYRTLTSLHRWWNPAHTWSGDATNLRLDARAGGCWCEHWTTADGNQSVEHMRITAARPGALLRASGGLGPLQQLGVSGALSWSLEPADGLRTSVSVEYAVSGWTPDGLQTWSGPVDFVIGEQTQRYARLINNGSPDPE